MVPDDCPHRHEREVLGPIRFNGYIAGALDRDPNLGNQASIARSVSIRMAERLWIGRTSLHRLSRAPVVLRDPFRVSEVGKGGWYVKDSNSRRWVVKCDQSSQLGPGRVTVSGHP